MTGSNDQEAQTRNTQEKKKSQTITGQLTAKQERFIEEYLVDLNATQAAIRAGYSKKTATTTACEYLAKPHIAAAIQKKMDERSERTTITADKVLEELGKIGFMDIRQLFDEDGRLRNIHELDDMAAKAVSSIKVERKFIGTGEEAEPIDVVQIKLWDKLKALELIGKNMRMWVERIEETSRKTVVIRDLSGAK